MSFTPSVQYIMDRFHWLPISTRIDFKIATLTYNTLSSGHPAYLSELISPYQPPRSLRSSSQLLLTVPRASLTIGQHAFCHSSPSIWNAIPLSVKEAPAIISWQQTETAICHSRRPRHQPNCHALWRPVICCSRTQSLESSSGRHTCD